MGFFGYISKRDVHIEAVKWATELMNNANSVLREDCSNQNDFFSYYEKSTIILKFGQKIDS
jgi:hypothetical protein